MSHPWGGHANFGQFKSWAESEGIQVQNGTLEIDGKSVKVTAFVKDGIKIPVTDVLDSEFLTATEIARLERRLGLESPFESLNPNILG